MAKTEIAKEQCIKNICCFPISYRADKSRTPIEIYNTSGYSKYHREISHDDIVDFVRENPSIIDDWIMFSQDKRWVPAWSFTKESKNTWKVFYVEKEGITYELTFSNPYNACAQMILMEMEQFSKHKKHKEA